MINLIRTKAGSFRVENSVRLEDLSEVSDVIENLINPLDILDLPKYVLNEDEREKVSHGMSLINSEGFRNSDIVILIYSGKIYAIGMVNTNKIMVKRYLRYYEKDYFIIRNVIVNQYCNLCSL